MVKALNNRTFAIGVVLLAIGITLGLVGNQLITFFISSHPNGAATRIQWDFAWASVIIGWLIGLAGLILIICGIISPAPPIHWNNNL